VRLVYRSIGAISACLALASLAACSVPFPTENPEAVAKVMEYLASAEVLGEFYGRTLFVPAHLGLSESGVEFDTDNPLAKHALETFAGAVPTISSVAFDLQGYVFNRVMFNAIISRLGEAIVGEMTLDEAYQRMEQDITQQIEEKKRGG